ncbi:MAG: class I SAM-dependent methyltransferase [Chloroflexi bacterium]|nr:class I SAM-dependent methyltransferase [Chloroflexota bacterium]
MNVVEQMYDEDSEHEWQRLERHRTEFGVTLRALAAYLPSPPATIFDIGGGPGRYAIALAKQGYDVTLLDLSQNNLSKAQEMAKEANVSLTRIVHGNALDLSDFADDSFDAVLMFGPLYHLLESSERQRAIGEGMRMLKDNGRFFAAFVTRFAPFRDAAANYPDWLPNNRDYAEHLLATGKHDQGKGFVNAYFAHPTKIAPLMESVGLSTLNLIGCEGVVSAVEEKVNQLTGADWDLWVDFNYRMGQEPSLHGAAEHLLYIGEKTAVSGQ